MIVELRPHTGIDVRRGEAVTIQGQDRLYVDGVGVGFVGWQEGAKILLTQRYSPQELQEIERKVELIRTDHWQGKMKAVQPPVTPPELLRRKENDGITENDFDS